MAETIFAKPLADPPFYNGLDKTVEGFALDARQGKVLSDQLTMLNSKIENGESVTVTAASGMTVNTQNLKKYGSIVTGTVVMTVSVSANTETEIATIPSGSRPDNSVYLPAFINSTGLFNQTASIEIRSNGKILIWSTQAISSKQTSFVISYHV